MEYQKIANLIDDNTLNQPSKFRIHLLVLITVLLQVLLQIILIKK